MRMFPKKTVGERQRLHARMLFALSPALVTCMAVVGGCESTAASQPEIAGAESGELNGPAAAASLLPDSLAQVKAPADGHVAPKTADGQGLQHPHADRVTIPDAKARFKQIVGLIESHYVDGALAEDELWSGAIDGVLDRLIAVPGHQINALLDPNAYRALVDGVDGEIAGIGVAVRIVADILVLERVLPGGPAEAAGLQAGDRVLGVDGRRVRKMALPDIVAMIRGPIGSKLELFVQRDTEEWDVQLERAPIEVPSIQWSGIDDDLAHIQVRGLSRHTAAQLDTALRDIEADGRSALVLDLRKCPGGLLEGAIDLAARFLPKGAAVVTLVDREGKAHEKLIKADIEASKAPLVVLVGHHTASGAEIVARALSHHGRARIVGQPSVGKFTVETVHELEAGWAVKLSSHRFLDPEGEVAGKVVPDLHVEVGGPDGSDRTLQAGIEWLRMSAR